MSGNVYKILLVKKKCVMNFFFLIFYKILQDEFIDDVDVLKGFLENNFSILLNCLSDDPVQKLMSRIRDSKTASSLLIDIIRKMLNESLIEVFIL